VARRRHSQHSGVRQDFPEAKIIRLEQNYRSTQNILQAASAVVGNNVRRKGKNLGRIAKAGRRLATTKRRMAKMKRCLPPTTRLNICARRRNVGDSARRGALPH